MEKRDALTEVIRSSCVQSWTLNLGVPLTVLTSGLVDRTILSLMVKRVT